MGGSALLSRPYKPLWHFPGGTVEADESPSAGCHREVLEELGIDVVLVPCSVWTGSPKKVSLMVRSCSSTTAECCRRTASNA